MNLATILEEIRGTRDDVAEDDIRQAFGDYHNLPRWHGVEPEVEAALQNRRVARDQPPQSQARKTIGLAHGTEADGILGKVACSGKAGGGIVLEFTEDFVAEENNVTAATEFDHLRKDVSRHVRSPVGLCGVQM